MRDTFSILAKHYDAMMSHVDYERWIAVSSLVADLCPDEDFLHLDIGCGTGNLVHGLRDYGWRSIGADLSLAMLHAGHRRQPDLPLLQADMTALPFSHGFHFATCVFDCVNFLLEPGQLEASMIAAREALTDHGVLYFDYISEKMVMEHYAGQDWVDTNDGVETRWKGVYDHDEKVISNTIWFDGKDPTTVRERIHTHAEIESALNAAGLNLLARLDTNTWAEPTRDTLRYDVIACVRPPEELEKEFRYIQQDVQILLAEADED